MDDEFFEKRTSKKVKEDDGWSNKKGIYLFYVRKKTTERLFLSVTLKKISST